MSNNEGYLICVFSDLMTLLFNGRLFDFSIYDGWLFLNYNVYLLIHFHLFIIGYGYLQFYGRII